MLWEEEKDAEMDVVGLGCVHWSQDKKILAVWSSQKGGGEWNQIQLVASPKWYSPGPVVFNISDLD